MSIEKAWPDCIFKWESEDHPHYCGSHWDAFYESADEVFRTLPERLPTGMRQRGFGDTYPGPHELPESWPKGIYVCWPNCRQGLIVTLRQSEGRVEVVNVSPFAEIGQQVRLEIKKVHVWSSGAEAQVEADWCGVPLSFFDLNFLSSRGWYEVGRHLDFILAGIAYSARPATAEKLAVDHDSPLSGWLGGESGLNLGGDLGISLEGSSIFLPVDDWDRDDYSFRGPVREVTAVGDWLGQSGWRVKVCIIQADSEDLELDVYVTGRSWPGVEPPEVGQDIEGTLWLQGRLWYSVP